MAEQLANLAKGDDYVYGNITSAEGSYCEEIIGKIVINNITYTKYKRTIFCGDKSSGSPKSIIQNDLNPVMILALYGKFGNSPEALCIPWADNNSAYLFNLAFNISTHTLSLNTNAAQNNIYVTIEYCK